jgi:hypothetical protein
MLTIGSGSMVFEPKLKRFKLQLKAQPIEPEEPAHKISLKFSVIQYLPLFLKLLQLDTKIKIIIHCNTCGALFMHNVFYRLKILNPFSGSQLFEPMNNINK